MLAEHNKPITFEEHALEEEVTHWMHVDWMITMTSTAACHCLLQQQC